MTIKKRFEDYSEEELVSTLNYYQNLIKYLEENNNTVPYARPMDRDGVERYDEADGYGYYRIAYNEFIYFGHIVSIRHGEYMNIPGYGTYTLTTKEIKSYLKLMKQITKELKIRQKRLTR